MSYLQAISAGDEAAVRALLSRDAECSASDCVHSVICGQVAIAQFLAASLPARRAEMLRAALAYGHPEVAFECLE